MNLWNCYNVKSMFGNTSTKYSFWTWPFLCLCTSFFRYFSISPLPSCPLTGLAIAREELQKTILQLWDFDLFVQVVHLAMQIRANYGKSHGNWQGSQKSSPLPVRHDISTVAAVFILQNQIWTLSPWKWRRDDVERLVWRYITLTLWERSTVWRLILASNQL